MIQRSDRPFLSIWRGDREFTEWRRGERVLWRKEVPEVPQEKLRSLTVTAASYADLALLDMVLWAIGQGHAGHVVATIAGEAHSLAGIGQLLTVRSEVVSNDGRKATLAIGEGSELLVGSLHAGDVVSLELAVDAGMFKAAATIGDGLVIVELPSLLPDSMFSTLTCTANKIVRKPLRVPNPITETVKLRLNDWEVGSTMCHIAVGTGTCTAWTFGIPESALNKAIEETDIRPMSLSVADMSTSYFNQLTWSWERIDTVLTFIVTEDADENML